MRDLSTPSLASASSSRGEPATQAAPMGRLEPCPIPSGAPFRSPWRRELACVVRLRVEGWLAELVPGADIRIVEWVGADPRQPLHALVISVGRRGRFVLFGKPEEVTFADVARALSAEPAHASAAGAEG